MPLKFIERIRRAFHISSITDDLHDALAERGNRALSKAELELLENAIAFSAVTADQISVSRSDIIAVSAQTEFADILKVFQTERVSRLPVYGKDLDDIQGFLSVHDMLGYLGRESEFIAKDALHPLTVVTENMPVPRVLRVMKKSGEPMVLVSDEFGGTSGLITLSDIVEKLIGSLDVGSSEQTLTSLGHGRFKVPANTTLEHIDRALSIEISKLAKGDVETLGGLVLKMARRIPDKGEVFRLLPTVTVLISSTDGRRLTGLVLELEHLRTGKPA